MSPTTLHKEVIATILDEKGRVKIRPSKYTKQIHVIAYLATKIPPHRVFSEKQINDILTMWHLFGDSALLRRELYVQEYLDREVDWSAYRRK